MFVLLFSNVCIVLNPHHYQHPFSSSASMYHPVLSEFSQSAAKQLHVSVQGKPIFLQEQHCVSHFLQVLQLTICSRAFGAGSLVIQRPSNIFFYYPAMSIRARSFKFSIQDIFPYVALIVCSAYVENQGILCGWYFMSFCSL